MVTMMEIAPFFEAGSFAAVLFVWREVVALRGEVTEKQAEFEERIKTIEERIEQYG